MMNRHYIIIIFILLLISCRKTAYNYIDEPEWLKQRIAYDEEMIRTRPELGLDAAAWIRYEWQGSYYFDYINLNNSGGPETYTFDGQKLSMSADARAAYQAERCCEHVVWSGARYLPPQVTPQ